jgi:predicted RNase H-like HicB family nuclease
MVTKKKIKKTPPGIFQVISGGVVFELQPEPERGYTVTVPSLPGCISYGKSFEEAMTMIKDAMEGWITVAREEGIPLPEQFEAVRLARN